MKLTFSERPLPGNMKVMPVVMEWSHWPIDYRSSACLYLTTNIFVEQLEAAVRSCFMFFSSLSNDQGFDTD